MARRFRAEHGESEAYRWLGGTRGPKDKNKRGRLSDEHRKKIGATHKRVAESKDPRYYEAQLQIRETMTPTALLALAREFEPALTTTEFYELAGKRGAVTTPVKLIARQLRRRLGRAPGSTVSPAAQERIRVLKANGLSLRKISEATRIPKSTVARVLRDL